jgi:predicted nucleic acid-binding protein
MNRKFFVDTNILIYAHDNSEPGKQRKAIDLLDSLALSMQGFLSTQVLAEFFWISTRKIPSPLMLDEAQAQIERLARTFHVVDINILVLLEALRGVRTYSMPLWDAQVWAAAKLNQIPVILSEDFSDGALYDGICCLNPFAPNFDASMIGL